MKTKFVSESAFFGTYASAGFLLRTIGGLLALLVSVALPTPIALANCGWCDDVGYEPYYGGYHEYFVELLADYPAGVTIFYTIDGTNPEYNPLTGNPLPGTYAAPSGTEVSIPWTKTYYFKALAHKGCYTDSSISEFIQQNPPQ